ncbi:MAG: 3-dehydroquinate synthase [Alphaproteobacteria bacterium]|nr:3-dehydroquinate synthase [Alphaproteobacteria bacterium]
MTLQASTSSPAPDAPDPVARGPIETVSVDIKGAPYEIHVGPDLLASAGERIAPLLKTPRVIVVTDETIAPLHLAKLQASLAAGGIEQDAIVLPPGEQTKSFGQLTDLVNALLDRKVERSTTLIALGGGVIGDLVGFAAAITLRGLPFVQIPTTLLAQVDSSVGGKTGINTAHGKNLVGAFHQPVLVLADTKTLDTLPDRELKAGYAEVVKYGLLGDRAFFDWLEEFGEAVLAGDEKARTTAIVKSCEAKAGVVSRDEKEAGERALLNLGHTFAHAYEAECAYSGLLLHGEAVAIGMVNAFDLSRALDLCAEADVAAARGHLHRVGLPVTPPPINGKAMDPERLMHHMAGDKKVSGGKIGFILARGIGEAFQSRDVPPEAVRDVLTKAVAAKVI